MIRNGMIIPANINKDHSSIIKMRRRDPKIILTTFLRFLLIMNRKIGPTIDGDILDMRVRIKAMAVLTRSGGMPVDAAKDATIIKD